MNTDGGNRTSRVGQRVGVLVGLTVLVSLAAWVIIDRDDDTAVVEATAPPTIAATTTSTIAGPATTRVDEETLITAFDMSASDDVPVGPTASDITVTLSDNTDLNDADWVTVGGAGFPADQALGVVTCLAGGIGVDACDVGTVVVLSTDKSGTFTTRYHLSRVIAVGTEQVDCAVIDCQLAAGAVSDTTQSGFVVLNFSADGEIVSAIPTLVAQPVDRLVDGAEVTITGQGFSPGSAALVQCVQGSVDDRAGGSSCFSRGFSKEVDVGADGTFTTTWNLRSVVPTLSGDVDCAQPPDGSVCVLVANVDSNFSSQSAPGRFSTTVELAFADA